MRFCRHIDFDILFFGSELSGFLKVSVLTKMILKVLRGLRGFENVWVFLGLGLKKVSRVVPPKSYLYPIWS